jgi:branched-chain amino acid transport system permease protein
MSELLHRRLEAAWTLLVPLAGIALLAIVADVAFDFMLERATTLALLYLAVALSLFVFSGLSGVLSFGQLGFVAIGAYTCALLTIPTGLKATLFPRLPQFLAWVRDVELGLWPAALLGGAVAAALALVVAPAIMRLVGIQAGIATLALLTIIHTVVLNWEEVTRGRSTMIGVPADVDLRTAATVGIAALVIAWAFQRSRVGMRLRAARDDELAARALGAKVGGDRTIAWVLGAFLAGVAGAFYAHFITTFTPDDFYLETTFVIIAMVVVGGMRSIAGVTLGVVVISALSEVLRRLQGGELIGVELPAGSQQVVLAGILLLCLIKRPDGLTGGREVALPRRWRAALPAAAGRPPEGGPPAQRRAAPDSA